MDLLSNLLEAPESVFKLSQTDDFAEKLNSITKSLLDPIAKDHSVLEEVYTDGLDSTQVFGQAQMILQGIGEAFHFEKLPKLKQIYGVSEEALSRSDDEASNEEEYLSAQGELSSEEENGENEEEEEDNEEEENEKGVDLEDEEEAGLEEDAVSDADSEETKVPSDDESAPTKDAFGLNDEFFDIDQFNKQIVALEDEPSDDEEEVDLFADLSDNDDDEEHEDMEYYDEFFDKPGKQKIAPKKSVPADNEPGSDLDENEYEHAVDGAMRDLFDDEDNEETKPNEELSTFEKQQQKLQAEIAGLEAELIAEKKWTMKGEVQSKDRPTDSLLTDDVTPNLEFDRTSKPVPVITDEVTETIEDLIRRRIKNDEFDDLPKRLITDVGKFVRKQKTEVSEEKSTKSLAELYEDEYHGVDPDDKVSEEVEAAHNLISDLFTKLNYTLDSLCSAHYIPKPSEYKSIEVKVSDAPASISMEDAQPLHVSDESKLAPQEIYKIGDDKPKADGAKGLSEVQLKSGLSYSKDELSRDDKQRLHRSKKRAKSKHFNELRDIKEQREKEKEKEKEKSGGDKKRQKVSDVVDTLGKAKNLTVIDKKGELRDASGNIKKAASAQSSSGFRL